MSRSGRPKRHIFLKIFTVTVVASYLVSVAGYYFSPLQWWPLGVASIAFAYLWAALAVLAAWWRFKKNRVLPILCLALMAAGFQPASVTFSIGWQQDYKAAKESGSLRVMQWNCMELPGNHIGWKKNKEERKAIETFLLKYQPDIICMEDFGEHIGKKLESNFAFIQDTLGYPHKVFGQSSSMDFVFGTSNIGTAIFSKHPFIRSGMLPFTHRQYPEFIVWADILLQDKPVRIVATHFRSMNLFIPETSMKRKLPYYLQQDSNILRSRNIFSNIIYYQAEHETQAKQLRAFTDTCPIPVILCTDMNTVPASYTYRQAKGNLQDGFLGTKTGLGNTYNYLLPNLRIDYLFHHPLLDARQWKHFSDGFFDHDHLMADFSWKPQ